MRIIAIGIGGITLGFVVTTFGLKAPKVQANNDIPKFWHMTCSEPNNEYMRRCENTEIICYVAQGHAEHFSCVRK